MSYRINNPGGGDCGFYAFAIGLIHVIQEEYYSKGNSNTFNRWKDEGLNMSLQDILAIELDWLACLPYSYKKDELLKLQMSLRTITVNVNKEDLLHRIFTELTSRDEQTTIEGSPVYGKFMELVQFYLRRQSTLEQISQYNELALSPEVLQLAQNTARSLLPNLIGQPFAVAQRIENAYVKKALKSDILKNNDFNSHSVILKGIEKTKENGRWATHSDLNALAERLQINLNVIGQINGTSIPHYPTITLNNESNAHWTTSVDQLFEQNRRISSRRETKPTRTSPPKVERVHSPEENYRKHVESLFDVTNTQRFFATTKRNVPAMSTIKAQQERYDELLATHLQEAELRRVLVY